VSRAGWNPGERIAARFTIDGPPLGEGASGVVYPAIDGAGAPVALKRLHPEVLEDRRRFQRLQREVARAGRLSHPNILPVRGLFPQGDDTVLVTARAAGGSVAELSTGLSPEAALVVALHVARALVTAHGHGLVHGDVRPGNVLLGEDGALLFDFGVAGAARVGELRPGETAPEVLDGAPPGERSDLYGLGLVLFHAATGRAAFDGPTAWSRIGRQREGRLDTEGLPEGLAACLRHLLHPDPVQRPPSAVAAIRMIRIVQRRPDRPCRVPRRRLPPVGLRRVWGVHGVDPSTGSRAMLRTGLSRREAQRLARRLDGEGWAVRADPLALAPVDLGWVLLLTLAFGMVLPALGAPLGLWLGARWRGGRVRHELAQALPNVLAPLPPRRIPPGGEAAVMVGLLLLMAAALSLVSGWLALAPLTGVVALVARGLRGGGEPASVAARRGRIEGAFLLARRDLDRLGIDEVPLDELLGRVGALDALEASWLDGDVSDEEVLHRLDPPAHHDLPAARTAPSR